MARKTKHIGVVKRFSLRMPNALYKAIRHATVETDESVNDYILGTIASTPRTAISTQDIEGSDRRYPLRLPVRSLEDATFKARLNGHSTNQWLLLALYQRTQQEGWLRKDGTLSKKAG